MFDIGNLSLGDKDLLLISGPCVIESRDHTLALAESISKIATKTGFPLVFKASFEKANRTSKSGYRGLGIDEGLKILEEVKNSLGLPVISDIHLPQQVDAAEKVLDILQIPAFLCRQTELLERAGQTDCAVMIKKGQFLAPEDMKYAAEKVGKKEVLLCERGTCFGYRDLVVDFRSFARMSECGYPVIFDATHSVQSMGGAGGSSSGNGHFIPMLTRAAVAAGVDGIFLECHEEPSRSPSDGANILPLDSLAKLLSDLKKIHSINFD